MPRKKTYEVALSEAERNHLKNLVSSGSEKAQQFSVWLRGIKVGFKFKLFNHKIEEMVPTIKIKITG